MGGEDFIKLVIDAISRLKPSFQEVLVMSCYEKMSNKDISIELGVSKLTIMIRLKRAKMALRKKMIELGMDKDVKYGGFW